VIASTAFDMNQAETFYIKAVDNTNVNKPVLTLDSPLIFTHFAKTENYGGVDFDIRAEVGLLTRNVVFRGDPETSKAN
jgi:cell migration-inducing and hyaluronan-binding protein